MISNEKTKNGQSFSSKEVRNIERETEVWLGMKDKRGESAASLFVPPKSAEDGGGQKKFIGNPSGKTQKCGGGLFAQIESLTIMGANGPLARNNAIIPIQRGERKGEIRSGRRGIEGGHTWVWGEKRPVNSNGNSKNEGNTVIQNEEWVGYGREEVKNKTGA